MHKTYQRLIKLAGCKGTELANKLHITPGATTNWTKRGVPKAAAIDAGKVFGFDPNLIYNDEELVPSELKKEPEVDGIALNNVFVWDGDGPESDDAIKVDLYKGVEFSAGDGMCHIDESKTGSIFFSKRSLKNQGVDIGHARFVTVTGTSGGERIPKGSVIGYDSSNRRVVDGELYALDHNGNLRVKVLYNQDDGGLKLHSYNEIDHPDETYSLEESREINISGRVFWVAYFLSK